MKYAEDFRAIARQSLSGNWKTAVLTGFLASLIGAEIVNSGGVNPDQETKLSGRDLEVIFGSERWETLRVFVMAALAVALVWIVISLVIGGAGKLGYATFNLKLVDGEPAAVSDLFSQFNRLWDGFCMNFLMGLYVLLWSLLFLIPGIVKGYSYAMTPYIMAEHPELTANEAITESRRIMDGNKWRLFCLGFSFIGWALLCSVPVLLSVYVLAGIFYNRPDLLLVWMLPVGLLLSAGYLFLRPYQEAAYAAFYRDVSGTRAYTVEYVNEMR